MLHKLWKLSPLALLFAGSATAFAGETITYSYDELGRLIRTVHSGTANDTLTTDIDYDAAGNRTAYVADESNNGTSNPSNEKQYVILPINGYTIIPISGNGDSGVTGQPGAGNGDTPPSFSISSASAAEGDPLSFTVTKSAATIGSYSVDWRTFDGSALNGVDYTGKASTMTFDGATTSLPITIETLDDDIFEQTKTFTLSLTGASNGATISSATGTGTINNDTDYINYPPNALDDFVDGNGNSYTVGVCESVTINVLANDNDNGNSPPDLPLMIVAVGSSTLGQAVQSGNMISFGADAVTGATQFTYTIRDSRGAEDTALVAVTVQSGQGCS